MTIRDILKKQAVLQFFPWMISFSQPCHSFLGLRSRSKSGSGCLKRSSIGAMWLVQWDALSKTYRSGDEKNPYLVGNIKNPKKIWPSKNGKNWRTPKKTIPSRSTDLSRDGLQGRARFQKGLSALAVWAPWFSHAKPESRWELLVTEEWYRWWTKSCTTTDDDYHIIYRVLTSPGGAGFLPSTVVPPA